MKKNCGALPFLFIAAALCCLMIQACASPGPTRVASEPEIRPALADREPILLVCPVNSVASGDEIASLSRTLAPLIRRDLFCVKRLSVIATEDTSAPGKSFFLTEEGLVKLSRNYGADMVTIGFVRGDSDNISIQFQVYDLQNRYFLLNTMVEGKPSKIFDLQRQLVRQLIDALGISLTKEETDRMRFCRPKKLEAAKEYGRGLKNEQNKMYTEALIAYQNALSADKSIAVPHAAEARIFDSFNAPLRAIESYENAVVRDESYAEAWYQLNLYAAHYKKRDDLAAEYCRKALEIAPRFGKARMSLGARLYALGDPTGAIEETKKALSLLQTDPQPRYNLGIYYLAENRPNEARIWFEHALRVDPAYKLAHVELQKLDQ